MHPLNIEDYRVLAKRRLPRGMFEYIDRGTEDEVGLRHLRHTLESVKLLPSVLNDVSAPDTGTVVFGQRLSMPVIAAPTAIAGMVWHDGEVLIARAARDAGIPFCASTQSITSMEHIAQGAPGLNLWFQLYVQEDRTLSWQLLDRAKAVDVRTLIITVDGPRTPKKEWTNRNGFGIPIVPSIVGGVDIATHPRWLFGVLLRYIFTTGMPTFAHYPPEFRTKITRLPVTQRVKLATRLTWDDVREIRKRWQGEIIIKGILNPDDADRALAVGADGIVVSSHGARNMDSAPAAIEVLPRISDRIGEKLTILADSGVHRGSDVVKYLAAGAKAVLVGRAPLYGASAAGESGAAHVFALLREELDHCLAFTGQQSVASVSRDLIWHSTY
jgi:L-lactate dehydrogenase (cytochrome)